MAYGKGKKKASYRSAAKRGSGSSSRVRSSGNSKRRNSGGRASQPVIRIELVTGGPAPLANPALPIPPSVRTPKSSKAKL